MTVLYTDLATWTTSTVVRTVHPPRQLIPGSQGWVQLHKITSITITITLKYQLQLQLHHHNVILNYNYTMFISITITITAPFLYKLHFYLWNCWLIGFGCFPCLACCLVPLSLAMLFCSIILQHLIAYHVWDN